MTKKSIFIVLLMIVLALAVTGCGKKAEPTAVPVLEPTEAAPAVEEPKSEEAAPAAEEKAAAPAEDGKVLKIAMIANAPIADGGWNSACYDGMVAAAEVHNFETAYSENVAQTDYVTMFTEYANMGFDLVFAPGNEFTDAVMEVAPSFPKVGFVILNGDAKAENVISIKADNTQMGFLAGALAGLKTKTKNVGFVGGMEITTALQCVNGYNQGTAYTNPDAKVHVSWANSWDDTAKGKEIAKSMIAASDVDVFFGTASAVDVGVREGVVESENRWAIAQPGDFLAQNPDIIMTSIVTDNTALIGLAMEKLKDGTFGNEVVEGGVKEKVLYLGEIGKSMDDVKEEFMKIYDDLVAGNIEIDYELKK